MLITHRSLIEQAHGTLHHTFITIIIDHVKLNYPHKTRL